MSLSVTKDRPTPQSAFQRTRRVQAQQLPNMIRPRHLFFCWLLAVLGLTEGAAHAASIEWRKPVFVYVAQEKRLAEVLQEFAASQNITAVADKAIDEKVSVSFRHHPNDVLRLLTANYGLIWYYD